MDNKYEEELKKIQDYFKINEDYHKKQLKAFLEHLNKTNDIIEESDECFGYKSEPIVIDQKTVRILESAFIMYMKNHIELYVTLCKILFEHNPTYLERIIRIIGKDAIDSLIRKGVFLEKEDEKTGNKILILKSEYEDFYKGLEDEEQ